ncbi:hypothetical protein [Microlunatus soli]|uniref:Phospholipase_D-nuclease N-terminal n=1 Tax=Microlunatus soli TaxID=630515 RepID=A0A1H1Q8A4_9ACTN|nr:hypothetical protein [Microlunatus soli]SDS19517.1 hypothetical protein SAMN04489812_1171 [Microlunatus soli]
MNEQRPTRRENHRANRRGWQDLNDRQRVMIIGAGALDLGLRLAGLIDIIRRPAAEVRGPKPLWIVALSVVSSAGLLPATYFALGRRRAPRRRAS